MNLSILLVGAALGGFVIFALIRELRKSAKLETKLEINEAENEAIKENIKATAIKEHELATASDDERIKLRRKWSRKP